MEKLPRETSERALLNRPDERCEKGLFFLAVIDMLGSLRFVNSYFSRKFNNGSGQKEIKNLFELIHENDREHFCKLIRECSNEEDRLLVETRLNPGDHLNVVWEISALKKDHLSGYKFLCLGYEIDGK